MSSTLQKKLVSTRCLLCEISEDEVLFPPRLDDENFAATAFGARRTRRREHYRIVRCRQCGLVRSDPILDQSSIRRLYEESVFVFAEEAPFAARTYANLLKHVVARHLEGKMPANLLEIGCSTGFFLKEALDLGVQSVVGIDPSRECFENALPEVRKFIVSDVFHPGTLPGKTFDMITSFHVIDHLSDPRSALSDLSGTLRPGGLALLVCHDVESWSAHLLGSQSPIFDVEHVYLFSRHTLGRLFEKTGFTVVETGSLTNRYPLGYWMRLLPAGEILSSMVPDVVKRIPFPVRAGNLYIVARRL